CGARDLQRIVAIPESAIGRRAEDGREKVHAARSLRFIGNELRRIFDQRRALARDRSEKFGMHEGETQRAESTHRDSADSPLEAIARDSIAMLDERDEFPQQEILVTRMAIVRIDIETRFGRGRHDQKFAQLVALPKICGEIHAARTDEGLFVIAEPVEKVQNRKYTSFVGVVAWRQNRAIGNLL